MMRLGNILIFLLAATNCFSQSTEKRLQGKVTFTSSTNAYVKFEDTEKIKIGDTLQLFRDSILSSCLVVKNKSSISCVCLIVSGCILKEGDRIVHPTLLQITKKNVPKEISGGATKKLAKVMSPEQRDSADNVQKISGRISAASYSTLSSTRGNNHRTMYRLSLDASHIKNSRFSLESDVNYRQSFLPKESTSSLKTKYFNVYNLAVLYETPTDFSLILGRKINTNASSIGAIDGLQAEKYFGSFYAGAIAGFRPDIYNQNFNSDLLQYGAYIGLKTNSKSVQSKSTLGILEQQNQGTTDRRYAYFQHTSTLGRNLNLFSSFELDVYDKINEQASSNIRLTNLYISTGYRISNKLNIFLSYDSRKRILYYETFKTEIERLLEDDEARQGARFRINFKPIKSLSTGISYSQRFQSSGQNKSDNLNGFITINKIPIIQGLLSVNYNINTSSYLESKVLSFRHSRYLLKNKLNVDFYYRMIEYKYTRSSFNEEINTTYNQSYYGTNLSYQIGKKITFGVLGELSTLVSEKNYRINARIIKRF